jgi:glycosyltransferase involved in cell wall biosynthesis
VQVKILVIHNRYRSGTPGGEDVVVDAEVALLREAGHAVVEYRRSNDEMHEAKLSDRIRTAIAMQGSRRSYVELSELIGREKPDIAHVHNIFPLISASAYDACADLGLPLVQTVHNYRLTCAVAIHFRDGSVCDQCRPGATFSALVHECYRGSRLATAAVLGMQRQVWRRIFARGLVRRFLALNQFAADRLTQAGIESNRVVIRPNFISIDRFSHSVAHHPQQSHARYAVFVGRLSIEKGLMTLLDAWRTVGQLELVVVGDGPLRERAQAYASEHRLRVRFIGSLPRDQALQLVSRATLQIVPSQWFEGMPLVILEAWALGVPVVAARIGGIAELLGDDERGVGFTPGDSRELSARISQLTSDLQRLEELRRNAFARYLQQHTPKYGLASLLEVYDSVLAS